MQIANNNNASIHIILIVEKSTHINIVNFYQLFKPQKCNS